MKLQLLIALLGAMHFRLIEGVNRGYAMLMHTDNPVMGLKKFIDFNDTGFADIDGTVTIMMWMRANDFGDDNRIIINYSTKLDSNHFQPFHSWDGLAFGTYNSNTVNGTAYKWRHLASVLNKTTITNYVDGVQTYSITFSKDKTMRGEEAYFHLGAHLYARITKPTVSLQSKGFRGWYDEVSMWSKPLTQSEIQQYMQTPLDKDSLPSEVVLYYPFDGLFSPGGPEPTTVPNYGSAGSAYDLLYGHIINDYGYGMTFISASGSTGGCAVDEPFTKPLPAVSYSSGANVVDDLSIPIVVQVEAGRSVNFSAPNGYTNQVFQVTDVGVNGTLTVQNISGSTSVNLNDNFTFVGTEWFSFDTQSDFTGATVKLAYGSTTQEVHIWAYQAPSLLDTSMEVSLLEDTPTKIRLKLKALFPSGEPYTAIITKIPTNGYLNQTTDSGTTDVNKEVSLDGIVVDNTTVTNVDGVVRYTPNLNFYGTRKDFLKAKFRSDITGVETGELTVWISIDAIDDAPTTVDTSATLVEESDGQIITLEGGDAESKVGIVITELPAKGKLYLLDENDNVDRLITEPYSIYNLGNVFGQYVSEVTSVSTFWGGPPYEGYSSAVILGPPQCGTNGNRECTDERFNDPEYTFERGSIVRFDVNYNTDDTERTLLSKITNVHSRGSNGVYDLRLNKMGRLVNGTWTECILTGSVFPDDCSVAEAKANGGSSEKEYLNVPRSALSSVESGIWCPLNKAFVGDHENIGGEDATAYGKEYGFTWNQADVYPDQGYTEFIEIKVEKPVYIASFEAGHPRGAGAIVRIKAKGANGEWHSMYDEKVDQKKYAAINQRRLYHRFSPELCRPFIKTDHVRIELDTSDETGIGDWNYIDYVQIFGAEEAQSAMLRYPLNKVKYVPDKNQFGKDVFTYQVYDCGGHRLRVSKSQRVEITITGTEDDPIFSAHEISLTEEEPIEVNLTTGMVDIDIKVVEPDEQTFTLTLTQAPGAGTLTVASSGVPVNVNEAIPVSPDGTNVLRFTKSECTTPVRIIDTFQVRSTDSNDNSADSTVEVVVDCASLPKRYEFEEIDSGAATLATALACIGIIVAALCFSLQVAFRKVPIIKFTSPYINMITIVGCVLVYGYLLTFNNAVSSYNSCAAWKLDSTLFSTTEIPDYACAEEGNTCCQDLAGLECYARVWFLSLGMVMAFGSLFSKTMRILELFQNIKKLKAARKITNRDLVKRVIALVSMLMLLLIVWAAASPISMKFEPGVASVDTEKQQIVVPLLYQCDSADQDTFVSILVVFIGALLLYGCYLAYQVRGVHVKEANDSKEIGLSVYTIVMFGSLNLALSKIVKDPTNLAYLLAIITFICVTMTLILLFAQRGYEVIVLKQTEVDLTSHSNRTSGGGPTGALTTSSSIKVQPTAD